MTCCDSRDYWAQRIATVQALITAYDAALLAMATGAQSYQLNTGQTQQMVTKANLGTVRATRDSLLNELATLEARVCGGLIRVVPGF